MERALVIEKFRNIGIKNSQKLVLNRSLEKGKIGNLVILIGANNAGKSNVLDALYAFGNKKFEKRDLTSLSYEKEYREPKLRLISIGKGDFYSYEITYGIDTPVTELRALGQKTNDFMEDIEELETTINTIYEIIQPYPVRSEMEMGTLHELVNQLASYDDSKKDSVKKNVEIVMESLVALYKKYVIGNIWGSGVPWKTVFPIIFEKVGTSALLKKYANAFKGIDGYVELEQTYKEKYKVSFVPQIIRYVEKQITTNDLNTDPGKIASNSFFCALLGAIHFKVAEIEAAYASFAEEPDIGTLKTLESKLNKKIKNVTKRFNKLYTLNDETYSFAVSLESSRIYFGIYRESVNQTLNYQSTGFKWFFDLYFNFLCSTSLGHGDVVIMDEPATNLHPRGQIELRGFLKDFAIQNDITIVLATHSPFLIDMDYLDELRVARLDGNFAYIDNDFSTINSNDPDALNPIKLALTVSNHVLLDPDRKVVFVEGITDYNYMVAFKNMLGITDITFLPVRGIGNIKDKDNFNKKQNSIIDKLTTIKKHDPILMVDNDGAGKSMKFATHDSKFLVFTLADASQEFKSIESLFDPNDLKKFGLVNGDGKYEKHSSTSSVFKTFTDKKDLSQASIVNFTKLFTYLENLQQTNDSFSTK